MDSMKMIWSTDFKTNCSEHEGWQNGSYVATQTDEFNVSNECSHKKGGEWTLTSMMTCFTQLLSSDRLF